MHFLRGALWLVALSVVAAPAVVAQADCSLPSFGPDRVVARVIDGETLELSDGARVALANVMAPKSIDFAMDADRLDMAAAATAALDALVTGQSVRLFVDAAPKDRYGQPRAIVQLSGQSQAPSVQVLLARDGLVRALGRLGERACADVILRAEDEARAGGRGLWAVPMFRVRPATPARDLAALRGTFQIVTGIVHAVERRRDRDRLVLGPERRRDLTISLRANDRGLVGALGGDLAALVGRRVEARGWLAGRSGGFGALDMDVSLIGHVRIIAD